MRQDARRQARPQTRSARRYDAATATASLRARSLVAATSATARFSRLTIWRSMEALMFGYACNVIGLGLLALIGYVLYRDPRRIGGSAVALGAAALSFSF